MSNFCGVDILGPQAQIVNCKSSILAYLNVSTLECPIKVRTVILKRLGYYIGLFGYYIKNHSLFDNQNRKNPQINKRPLDKSSEK